MISLGTSSSSSLCVSFSFLCNGISILLIITRLYVLSSISLFVPYTYHSSSLLHCISQLITTSPFITLCPTYSPIPIYGVTSSTTFSKSFTRSIVFTMLSQSLRTYSKKQYIIALEASACITHQHRISPSCTAFHRLHANVQGYYPH